MSTQRWSKPGAHDVPGADDMQTAPDQAMPDRTAQSPQEADPGGYPHPPAEGVPKVPGDDGRSADR